MSKERRLPEPELLPFPSEEWGGYLANLVTPDMVDYFVGLSQQERRGLQPSETFHDMPDFMKYQLGFQEGITQIVFGHSQCFEPVFTTPTPKGTQFTVRGDVYSPDSWGIVIEEEKKWLDHRVSLRRLGFTNYLGGPRIFDSRERYNPFNSANKWGPPQSNYSSYSVDYSLYPDNTLIKTGQIVNAIKGKIEVDNVVEKRKLQQLVDLSPFDDSLQTWDIFSGASR